MRLNTNVPSLITARILNNTNNAITSSSEKLSSGLRINSAKDDATGIAIANKLRFQVGALELASRNALEGVSLVQTADGALNEMTSIIQRMRELAVQSANETLSSSDRNTIQTEINQLTAEVDGIASRTEYNKIKVFTPVDRDLFLNPDQDREASKLQITLQIGPNTDMEVHAYLPPMTANLLGIDDLDYITTDGCTEAIIKNDEALAIITDARAELGAMQNRLEVTIDNLDNAAYNIDVARSRIEDTDMAFEMSEYTKLNVLSQAGIAVLAQSNQRPSQLLSLIQ